MPYLLPSQATRSIQILAPDVSTSLSISAPASKKAGESFAVSGILVRNDTGGPVSGASIALKYNGTSLGSATTGVDGDYLRTVSIPSVGTFTLTASFGGMTVAGVQLGPSEAYSRLVLQGEVSPLLMLAVLAGGYLLLKGR